MATNLIQRLRTCSANQRKDIAMELAQTGTDEAVQELIRMIEGRRRYLLRWYSIDDQLHGIEALGETGKTEFCDYLNALLECEVNKRNYTTSDSTFGNDWHHEVTDLKYPNVRGKLGRKLKYLDEHVTDIYGETVREGIGPDDIQREFWCIVNAAVIKLGG